MSISTIFVNDKTIPIIKDEIIIGMIIGGLYDTKKGLYPSIATIFFSNIAFLIIVPLLQGNNL
jgi:hypothetical protein